MWSITQRNVVVRVFCHKACSEQEVGKRDRWLVLTGLSLLLLFCQASAPAMLCVSLLAHLVINHPWKCQTHLKCASLMSWMFLNPTKLTIEISHLGAMEESEQQRNDLEPKTILHICSQRCSVEVESKLWHQQTRSSDL